MRRLLAALLSALLPFATAAAEPEKVACQSGLRGDFTFKTCADFCKPTRASNHCRFCKCQQCPFCTAVQSGVTMDGGAAAPAAAALDQPASVEVAPSRRLPPSNRRPRAGPPPQPPLSGPIVAASQPDGDGGGGGSWSTMGLVGLIVLSMGGAIATAVGYWALSAREVAARELAVGVGEQSSDSCSEDNLLPDEAGSSQPQENAPHHAQVRVPCRSSLPWLLGAGSSDPWLRDALGASRPAAQGPMGGCEAAVPGRSRRFCGVDHPAAACQGRHASGRGEACGCDGGAAAHPLAVRDLPVRPGHCQSPTCRSPT